MDRQAAKAITSVPELVCGLYSKSDAARIIADGTRHLHSSTLGIAEASARQTIDILKNKKIAAYDWELAGSISKLSLGQSVQRAQLIKSIVASTGIERKPDLASKLGLVLEELTSNALYHSFENEGGAPKYPRNQSVSLSGNESIQIQFFGDRRGIYLSVIDSGGTIRFDHIIDSFKRCYGSAKNKEQIATKENGAGLGLYMIFEMVTHLKIVCTPKLQTIFSCWLPDSRSYNPDFFSFNFFDGRFE